VIISMSTTSTMRGLGQSWFIRTRFVKRGAVPDHLEANEQRIGANEQRTVANGQRIGPGSRQQRKPGVVCPEIALARRKPGRKPGSGVGI